MRAVPPYRKKKKWWLFYSNVCKDFFQNRSKHLCRCCHKKEALASYRPLLCLLKYLPNKKYCIILPNRSCRDFFDKYYYQSLFLSQNPIHIYLLLLWKEKNWRAVALHRLVFQQINFLFDFESFLPQTICSVFLLL